MSAESALERYEARIRAGKPEAVIMIGAYKPCAEFIKVAKKVGMDAVFLNVSFVGSKALAKELGNAGEGVVVTQVVPFHMDTSIPLVAQYQAALKQANPDAEPGFVSLEGYMVGRFFIEALRRIEGEPTRQGLLDVITQTATFDLGGVELIYGSDDNQGMDQVFLTVIQSDGTFQAVDRLTRKTS